MMIKAKKISAGNYVYTKGDRSVEVFSIPPNPAFGDTCDMWVATQKWDDTVYTDPLPNKWMAVEIAKDWLN